ncbi:MAG: hypothetical protein NTV23_03405 [Propionibacteriales bacterium]|nr:hypothetical protein [Propionibacteriales bacterium]
MSKLADPTICPDCRARLDPTLVCTGCGLALQGQAAADLWEHLQQADALITSLRIPQGGPVPSRTAGLPAAPPVPVAAPVAAPVARRQPWRLSVPVVLLGLGGICVLVAAIVFVAVTWSSLGLAGRTAVMIGVTAITFAAAAMVTRRGLRGGAETLWLVTHVLVAIDVVAAAGADLAGLGDAAPQHLLGGLGALLLVSSLGVAAWAARTTVPRLTGLVGVTAVSTLVLTAAEAWAADSSAAATAVSLPLLAAAVLVTGRLAGGSLKPHAGAVAGVGALSWLVLVGHGLARSGSTPVADWWQDLAGWPLLVAAAFAALATVAPVAPVPRSASATVRSLAAGASLVCLALLAGGGTAEVDGKILAFCAVAVALAGVSASAPSVWSRPAALLSAVAALVGGAATLVRPFGVTENLPTSAPATGAGRDLILPATTWDLASWTAPVVAAAAVLCLAALVRHLPETARDRARSTWLAIAPILVGVGLATWFLESEPRLVLGVAAWTLLLALAAVLTGSRHATDSSLVVCLALDLLLVCVGLRLAAPSHLLVALVATLAACALAVGALRSGVERLGNALVPLLTGAAAGLALVAATQWPYLLGGGGDASGLTVAVAAAMVGVAASRLGRTPAARVVLEVLALLTGLAGTAVTTSSTADAAVLTIIGTAIAVVSILHTDRDLVSWLASGVLALAVATRLDDGAAAPELVALPAAALLVAAGVRRLSHDPAASSWRMLGSGLSLGLVPSLLGALDDPVSVRGALVAVAGLGFLSAGVNRRWAAPFAAGAAVVALIALRHLGPVAAALPRWISLGSVGVLLLLVGITWEARRRDAAKAERYLAALR